MKARMVMVVAALVAGHVHAAPAAPVVVGEVVQLMIAPTTAVTGTVHARDEMQVTAGVDGRITFVAEPGARVAAGEPLMGIDTTALELRRAELEAQAERARAQLRYLDAQLARQRELAGSGVLSKSDFEQTTSQRDVAANDLRIAEVRLLQVADDIARATVSAAFDGVVTERLRRAGEEVGRGTVVARVIDAGALEVRVLAPLQYAGLVASGDRLRVRAAAREVDGIVRSLVPVTDARRQAFELRIDLPRGARWSVGELVSVSLPVLAPEGSVAVPQDALLLRQDGIYVYRILEDGTAERIAVEVGDSHDGYVVVAAPLTAGDRVVVRGGETLAPGQRVRVL